MINFTVGPVQESKDVLEIGAQRTPYFRNESFSKKMLENEKMIMELAGAHKNSRAVFLTASGTGAMEAAVINSFSDKDKVLVIDGGSFGHRFAELCRLYGISHTVLEVPKEMDLTKEMLSEYDNQGYTGLLINMHETSIGKLYDMELVSEFCIKNNLFLVVDAISAFIADDLNMAELGIDMLIISSQKALAVPPGISAIIMSPEAVERVNNAAPKSFYFNLKDALKNGERGQTPFTPAVSILLQIHERLDNLIKIGIENEKAKIAGFANQFRTGIADLPISIPSYNLSNAVTPIYFNKGNAYDVFLKLEREYGIWLCPSGGTMKDVQLRVGHLGDLTKDEVQKLIDILHQIM